MQGYIRFSIMCILIIFSTAVMSYVAMATPIGPWIAPTVALLALLLCYFLRSGDSQESALLITAGSSVGGIVATALGFSFPTLYFLDASFFNAWIDNPLLFCAVIGGIALSAGLLGMVVADFLEHDLVVVKGLSFPIGRLVYNMLSVQRCVYKGVHVFSGVIGAFVFCLFQSSTPYIPKQFTLLSTITYGIFTIPSVRIDIWPMLWAVGYVAGHIIAIPLFIGAMAKIICLDPINALFFPHMSSLEFVFAFCSGMVLSGTITSIIKMPINFFAQVKRLVGDVTAKPGYAILAVPDKRVVIKCALTLAPTILFLTYFQFSLWLQVYLVGTTLVCIYQICGIAGEIGLAPLGRFATFVMVPALIIFHPSHVQLVLIATYVEVAGGVAADILFGRKMGYLAGIQRDAIKKYQFWGLFLSACIVGILFWALITRFGLGTEVLFAYKAQSRRLLLSAGQFDYWVLGLGCLVGYALKYLRVNPMLVLGGILMPLSISIGLLVGGFFASIVNKGLQKDHTHFWSGVFAGSSVWMIFQAIFGW